MSELRAVEQQGIDAKFLSMGAPAACFNRHCRLRIEADIYFNDIVVHHCDGLAWANWGWNFEQSCSSYTRSRI